MLLLSLLLFFLSTFRPGFSVTAGNWSSEEVYSPWQLLQAVSRAEALAEEILMEDVSLKGCYKLSLKFTALGYSRNTRSLTRALLEQVPGIARLCAVMTAILSVAVRPLSTGRNPGCYSGRNSGPPRIRRFKQK